MSSNTSLITENPLYQSWLDMIKSCKSRPADVTVKEWCRENDLTTTAYYARIKTLRRHGLLQKDTESEENGGNYPSFAELTPPAEPQSDVAVKLRIGNSILEISESIPDTFLYKILEAAAHVK